MSRSTFRSPNLEPISGFAGKEEKKFIGETYLSLNPSPTDGLLVALVKQPGCPGPTGGFGELNPLQFAAGRPSFPQGDKRRSKGAAMDLPRREPKVLRRLKSIDEEVDTALRQCYMEAREDARSKGHRVDPITIKATDAIGLRACEEDAYVRCGLKHAKRSVCAYVTAYWDKICSDPAIIDGIRVELRKKPGFHYGYLNDCIDEQLSKAEQKACDEQKRIRALAEQRRIRALAERKRIRLKAEQKALAEQERIRALDERIRALEEQERIRPSDKPPQPRPKRHRSPIDDPLAPTKRFICEYYASDDSGSQKDLCERMAAHNKTARAAGEPSTYPMPRGCKFSRDDDDWRRSYHDRQLVSSLKVWLTRQKKQS